MVDNAALYRGWVSNPDGGGFAYVNEKGEVVIEKGFMKYGAFQKAYEQAAEKYADNSPFLVHMRITTSGGTNPYNTHPFQVKGGAMIHNGVLFSPTGKLAEGKGKNTKSDTHVLTTVLHNVLTRDDVKAARDAIGDVIGYNKLAFLYDNKEFVIVNEDFGSWDKGIWYSNDSCEAPAYDRAG